MMLPSSEKTATSTIIVFRLVVLLVLLGILQQLLAATGDATVIMNTLTCMDNLLISSRQVRVHLLSNASGLDRTYFGH